MLKVNLLPAYIYERRKVRKASIGFVVLFVAVVLGMLAWWTMLNSKQKALEVQVADMEMKAQEVTRLEQEAQAEENKIPIIQAKVAFIEALMDYNLQAPKLYEELAKYTYSRVLYRSIQPASNQLMIEAHARTLGDCGRYLMNIYRATHLFNSVVISGVPGWPKASSGGGAVTPVVSPWVSAPEQAGALSGFNFQVTCTLVQQIIPPIYGGAAAQVPGAMPGGAYPPAAVPGQPAPAAGSPSGYTSQ